MYLRDENGNVGMILALLLPVLFITIGVAFDLSQSVSLKTKAQDYLDDAMLAAIHEENAQDAKEIAELFLAKLPDTAELLDFKFSDTNDDRTVSATLSYPYQTILGGFIGQDVVPVSVQSKVSGPLGVSSMRIRLEGANGFWGKTARIIGTSGSTETTLATAHYSYDMQSRTPSFSLDNSSWMDVAQYDDVFIEFQLEDNPHNFDAWCGIYGCPNKIFRTNDPTYTNRITIDGVQQNAGTAVDFTSLANCGTLARHQWEDGAGVGPDFSYFVEGRCERVDSSNIFLSK